MDFKELNKEIKTNINKVYLFKGQEEYLMDFFIDKIVDSYVEPGLRPLNYIDLKGENLDFDLVLNTCETLPFASDKKVVVLRNLGEALKRDSKLLSRLGDYVLDLGAYNIVIIKDEAGEIRGNTKVYKNVKKLGGLVEFEKLNNSQLNSWISRFFKERELKISQGDLEYLKGLSGYLEYRSPKTLYEFKNDLKKIGDHSKDGLVTRQDIDRTFIRERDTNIFNLLEALNQKNPSQGLRILNNMAREDEPMARILFMITRQFRLLLKYKIYEAAGYDYNMLRNKLKISPYEFKKISGNSRLYRQEELIDYLNKILELERRQRTVGLDEKLALEMLVVYVGGDKF